MKSIISVALIFLCIPFCNAQLKNSDTLKFGDIIYTNVDVEAQFEGGDAAWRKYLMKKFKIEKVTKKMELRDTTYYETAIVKFVVKEDGRLADIKIENEVQPALKSEALKVIVESPNWIPAMRNGKNVNAYRRLPISIIVSGK